jgi:glycosyltransferase involved in cell wall biosynthesis
VELRVLTSDMAGPKVTDRLQVGEFPTRFPAGYEIYYTRRIMRRDVAPGLLLRLWSMVGWAEVVLLTGTYSLPMIPTLLACRLKDKPLVWSPRGALQATHEWDGARRLKLKRAWETVCRLLKSRRCVLHVTAEVERQASIARLPNFDAVVIPNAVEIPQNLPQRSWRSGTTLRLMFISRIDPKKGLEVLLRAMPSILDATLDIYGTGVPSYVQAMQQLAGDLGVAARVRFHGHVDGEAKRDAFLNADLFVLPPHSENFGMVVAEALAHGVPAVVSHRAPGPSLRAARAAAGSPTLQRRLWTKPSARVGGSGWWRTSHGPVVRGSFSTRSKL